ncbi:MAG: response regulator [Planctomycetota bacterium]
MGNVRSRNRPIEILHVEDSRIDAKLAQLALSEFSVENRVHHVTDGGEAMAFLGRQGKYENAPRPDLILLDLNLPVKDGREVLAEVRSDPKLKSMVVIILSSSDCEEDILACYQLNCNAYLTKQMDIDDLMEAFKAVELLFLQVARLPTDV